MEQFIKTPEEQKVFNDRLRDMVVEFFASSFHGLNLK